MRKSALAVTGFLVCSTFPDPAWAERIGANNKHAASLLAPDNVALDALQLAAIAGADSDWHETPGADVWSVSFDGLEMQVKVLPINGQGTPSSCCFNFAVGDAAFWIRAKGFVTDERNNSGNPLPPTLTTNGGPQLNGSQSGASDYGADRTSATGPFDPLDITSIDPISPVSSARSMLQTDVSVAQVPEPALMLMFGIAVAAAARRVKTRQRFGKRDV